MADGALRQVSCDEAIALQAALPGGLLPATMDPRYVVADAQRHDALQSVFVCYERGGDRWLHGFHVTDVPGTRWRDASSPYGYGGPVASTTQEGFVHAAWEAYARWMKQEGIVVEYVRFHPVLGNERVYGGTVTGNRDVVDIDLTLEDPSSVYAPRLMQTVRKAQRAGLRYEEQPLRSVWREFGAFHRAAMREMNADAFYLFDDAYFEALAALPGARVGLCTGSGAEGGWLAAALFLDGRGVREYHLAATNAAGRKAGASSFTLHRGAVRAKAMGLSHLYLGGGTAADADNPLFFFKAGFSPSRLIYRTGASVFDAAGYEAMKRAFPEAWQTHPERPIFHRKV
jgi:hypothetical protein